MSDKDKVATPEQTMEFLRRHGWVRNDGDGERFHTTRPIDARNEDERCTMYYQRKCRYTKGHPGPHRDAPEET